jgi:hypothetical protein
MKPLLEGRPPGEHGFFILTNLITKQSKIMKTWTLEEVQNEILKETESINGQEFLKVDRLKEIFFDKRFPSKVPEGANELMLAVFKHADELKKQIP